MGINLKIKKMQKFNLCINIIFVMGMLTAIILNKYYTYIGLSVFVLLIIKHFILWDFFKKNLKFTSYVIKDGNLYKVGSYPKGAKRQNDSTFRLDHFRVLNELKKWYGFLEYGIFNGGDNRRTFSVYRELLDIMQKLTNYEYLGKIVDGDVHKRVFEVYQITKVYSYEYDNSLERFNLICDSIDLSNNLNYEKAEVVLNTFGDDTTKLENYLKEKSLNMQIKEEQKYENSVVYERRKKSRLSTTIISVLMLIIVFALVILFTEILYR